MRRIAVLGVLMAPFLAWGGEKATRADLKALSGTWVAAGGEGMGKEIPKGELPFQWTFGAGGKAVFADTKRGGESHYTFTLDASKKPKRIDVTYEGPVAAMKGEKQLGIYKMENDKLTLCLTFPGATEKDRPTGFTTKERKVLLMRFERAKAGE